jgi:excisionase family DNA binding protein
VEDKTNVQATVTISAATVGTDAVSHDFDPRIALSEAEAAVVRAQMNGGNRLERVALLPTAVTIPGAATLLGLSNREVIKSLRSGDLTATRRGRHLYIDRDAIDGFRRRG